MKARNKFGATGTPGRPEAPLKLSSVVYVKRCAPAEYPGARFINGRFQPVMP